MKLIIGLGLLTALTIACSSSAADNAASFIPGNRAFDGDRCQSEDEPGRICVNEIDRCSDGGFRPSRMTCRLGTWRCLRDPIANCERRETPTCTDGTTDGSCDLGYCPNGSRVPATRLCIGGQFICQPVMPGCARVETDAGTPDTGTTDSGRPMEAPALSVHNVGPDGATIYAGRNNAILQWTQLHATRELEVRDYRFRVVANSGQISDRDGNAFLRNLRLRNEATGQILMGPIQISPGSNAREAVVRFSSSFTMDAGQTLTVTLTADVPNRLDPALVGTRFRVIADGGNGHYFPDAAVRSIRDGAFLSSDTIEGNNVVTGNEFVVARPTLTLNLASEPAFQVVTKNTLNVFSAGIDFTADPANDIRIGELSVTGVGDIGHGLRRSDLSRIVVACSIYDGDTRVSRFPMTPDSMFGRMVFTGLNLTIPRGTTRNFRVGCSTDSVVENPTGGDTFAVTIEGETDVRAVDPMGSDPGYVVSPTLTQQIYSPTVRVMVVRSGSLSLRSEVPTRREYMSGDDDWHTVGYYNPTSRTEDISLERLAIRIAGNSACVSEIGLMRISGGLLATGRVPSLEHVSTVDVEPISPIVATRGGSDLVIVARFNRTVTTSTDPGACITNSVIGFSLASGVTTGEWDDNYSGNFNVRATGLTSGERIYTAAPTSSSTSEVILN